MLLRACSINLVKDPSAVKDRFKSFMVLCTCVYVCIRYVCVCVYIHSYPFIHSDRNSICRSMYAVYKEDQYVKDIKLRMYTTPDELFQNSTVNKENAPFCVPKCYGTGILHIGQCLPMSKFLTLG